MEQASENDLIAQLRSGSNRERRSAARRLANRKTQAAVPALIERLRDGRSSVQQAAALALGEIRDPDTIPILIDMFHGNTYQAMTEDGAPHRFRRILGGAGIALTRFNHQQSVEPLYTALADSIANFHGDDVTLTMHADCVSYIGGERAYDMLHSLWADPRFNDQRALLALPLGRCGDKHALPELVAAMGDQQAYIRTVAAEGLGLLGDTAAVFPLILRFISAEAGLKISYVQFHKQLISINAARSLGQLRTTIALTALKAALWHPDRRFAAAVGLGYAGDSAARDILIPFAVSKDERKWGLKTVAVEALAALDDLRALPALQAFTQEMEYRGSENYPAVEAAVDRWQGLT